MLERAAFGTSTHRIMPIIKLVSILTKLCNARAAKVAENKSSLKASIDDGGRKQFQSLRLLCHFLFRAVRGKRSTVDKAVETHIESQCGVLEVMKLNWPPK